MTRTPPQINVRFGSADTLAENTDPVVVVLNISRVEIEAGNVASALERLLVLVDTKENTLLYRESLQFIVTGYDHDPRHLVEIPEVGTYFRLLSKDWPHWLWFLSRGCGSISLLIALLCDVRVISTAGKTNVGIEMTDVSQLRTVMLDLFSRGNSLFDAMDIPENDVSASADSAVLDLTWSAM